MREGAPLQVDGTTIAAIASAPGVAARGVIRISGPRAGEIVQRSCSTPGGALALGARGLFELRFDDGQGPQPCLLLWMPGPRSFTREDVAELHLPGNPHLLAIALERVLALGARAAVAGEFTRRAFTNGRLDLTRAEGVAELVAARSAGERRAASALLMGGLQERIEGLREQLEHARTLCEASLDFDETDTGHVPVSDLDRTFASIEARLRDASRWEERRLPDAGLPRVVLSGAPNVGKSTLFNRLVEGDVRAIVTRVAGTTRDALSGVWSVAGSPCRLVDSAGVEAVESEGVLGQVERAAQRQAREARGSADLVLWLVDRAAGEPPGHAPQSGAEPGRESGAESGPESELPTLFVSTKWDGNEPQGSAHATDQSSRARPWLRISARTGQGLEALEREVARRLGIVGAQPAASTPESGEATRLGSTRELTARHRLALREALERLADARAALRDGAPLDLVAEELRAATDALDQISGRTTPEDLLDRIFASFCLGK